MRLSISLGLAILLLGSGNAVFAQSPPPASTTSELLGQLWTREQPTRLLLTVPLLRDEPKLRSGDPRPQSVEQWLASNQMIARTMGGMTVLGRRTTTVPTTELAAPDFAAGNAGQQRSIALPQLLASLSDAQWRQIASSQGLGRDGLSEEQKALWEACVPNPFVFERTKEDYSFRTPVAENVRKLTEAQRQQVRLRVKVTGTAAVPLANQEGNYSALYRKNRNARGKKGEMFLAMVEDDSLGNYQRNQGTVSAFGQSLVSTVPNLPKRLPAAVEDALPATPIAIDGRENLSIGALLDRITTTTGKTFHVSRSVRNRLVRVYGSGQIGAGDLLRALLFATGNTVRVLPSAQTGETPLHVIAPDREPTGRLTGRIQDWLTQSQSGKQSAIADAYARIAATGAVSLLRFDADDPMALTDAQRARVDAAARKSDNGQMDTQAKATFSELSPTAQKMIGESIQSLQAAAAKYAGTPDAAGQNVDFSVRAGELFISYETYASYVVPGVDDFAGEIDAVSLAPLSPWLSADTRDAVGDIKGRIVVLAPRTVEEARARLDAARAAGVREVWVQASPEIVAAAAAAGTGVPVRAVVSSLRSTDDTPEELPRDENVYGKTSREWLLPDDPRVIQHVRETVRATAATPGIAGIVLRDIVPPGYRGKSGETEVRVSGSETAQGYTLAHRRAFAQETGTDPADLVETMPLGLQWHFNPAMMDEWRTWSQKRLTPLWTAIREASGKTPIFVEGAATFREEARATTGTLTTFIAWNTRNETPPLGALFRNTRGTLPLLSDKPAPLVVIAGNPGTFVSAPTLLQLTKREDKPAETIWDLSDNRIPGVKERLRLLEKR